MRVSHPIVRSISILLAVAATTSTEAPLLAATDTPREATTRHPKHSAQSITLPRTHRSVEPNPSAVPLSHKPPASGAVAAKQEPTPSEHKGAACPEGMLLIDGDYCTEVEHKCAESWYDKSNKKTVCERFESWSKCKGNHEHKRFCMDRYEYPNRAGERPEVMNRFNQAEVKCAALGKRLCTETEWTTACEGPKFKPFPYGYVRDTNTCHGDVMWDSPDMQKVAARDPAELARLWKGVRSGSQPECISDYGVYDMPGNADEVVASETYASDFRGKFDSVHTGGPWYKGVRNQCRPKIYTHDEGFYYYFLSFRCCAEADRKETDPRTPKQRKANWKFEKVEQIAGFTRHEVQKALKMKTEKGNCGCKAKDTRCNTICGTLLGADAHDFPKTRGRATEGRSHEGNSAHSEQTPSKGSSVEPLSGPTPAPTLDPAAGAEQPR